MLVNEEIVKITGRESGHNYVLGEFYTMGVKGRSTTSSCTLLELIKIPGISFIGNSIRPTDFEVIDVFSNNEEFLAFVKRKEAAILKEVIVGLKRSVMLKEDLKGITAFANKEEYLVDCITQCKDSLADDEDANCKEIVTLLTRLVA